MSIDPVTAAKAAKVGHAGFKFWRRNELGKKLNRALFPKWMARRDAKKAARGETVSKPVEASMDQQVVTQILLGIVRHAMTATGAGVYLSDDLVVQVVSAVVALGGAVWMARRKMKAAKPAA